MAADGTDKRFKRYLILAFAAVCACVVVVEACLITLVRSIVPPIMSNIGPIQAFLVAQSALVFLAIPIIVGALVFARLARGKFAAELEAAEEERRQYYAQRNLMLSDMAHDLRTPVMGISGLARALEDGMVEDEATRQRYLHSIVAKSEKMGDLATMLFDYIKLESKGFSLERKPVELSQLLLNEAAALYTDAEDAGMTFCVEVSEEETPLWADERQMKRVVSNLVANAIRHNPPGTAITLALVRRAGIAEIVVADTGTPIEGDPNALFEPFARGDKSRAGGGNGLGLSIAKTIVDMHGYSLTLQQPYGRFTKAFVIACTIERR